LDAAERAAEFNHFCSIAFMRNDVVLTQAATTIVCLGLAGLYRGEYEALAALYGGAVATANTWLLTMRIARAGELAKHSVKYSVYSLYFGAVQRFIFVLVGLGVGLGGMKLSPIPLLLTFGIAQLAFMIAAGREAMKQIGHSS